MFTKARPKSVRFALSRTAAASAIALGLCAQSAHAAEADKAGVTDSDIVVTARRTNERLQDVPVAVTAITSQTIESRNMRSLVDVAAVTPSLILTPQNAVAGKSTIGLRGQRQSSSGISVDQSVAVYINEQYMARTSIDGALYDVDSIQVLKGPQGTLFGRNSTGGAVLLSTKRPGSELGGYVRFQVEDPWAYYAEGAINLPLGEDNGLRIAATRQYRQGYDTIANLPGDRVNDRNRWGVRATLKLGSGPLTSTIIADYFRWDEHGSAYFPLARTPNPANTGALAEMDAAYVAAAANRWADSRVARTTGVSRAVGRNWSVLNITEYELSDDIRVKNIVGYASTNDESETDGDGTPAQVIFSRIYTGQEQVSEEFQVSGKSFGGSLDWIVGAYYFRESGFDYGSGTGVGLPLTSPIRTTSGSSNVNTAWSAFAHASYLLPIGVPAHIFGGIRPGKDRREVTWLSRSFDLPTGATLACFVFNAPALTTLSAPCAVTAAKTYSSTTWDVGVDIKPVDDLLLYASVSRGFRTGGFNGRAASATNDLLFRPFNPETVLNYEAGFKFSGDIGGMRSRLNVAAYHTKYNDIQQAVSQINPATNSIAAVIINAATARVNGIEVEASIKPVPSVELSGFYSLTDAKYLSFIQQTATGPQDLTNNRFAAAPRNMAGAALDWDVLEGSSVGDLHFNLNFRFTDDWDLQPINVPGGVIPASTIWNGSLKLNKAFGTPASIELYVKNLFDKNYATGGFATTAFGGLAVQVLAPPRVIGVGFRLPFGGE